MSDNPREVALDLTLLQNLRAEAARRGIDLTPTPSVCDPNALTGTCRWDHDHSESETEETP